MALMMLTWIMEDASKGPWPSMSLTVKCEFGLVDENSTNLYYSVKGKPMAKEPGDMQLEFFNYDSEKGTGLSFYNTTRGTAGKTVTLRFAEH